MRKQKVSMQNLINMNRKEILSSKTEMDRIEKQIDEKFNKQLQKSS
jgi:hypothetical protein